RCLPSGKACAGVTQKIPCCGSCVRGKCS
nr:Chain A, Covalitoxin-I [synthetic construct]